jgi:hypothetical protein
LTGKKVFLLLTASCFLSFSSQSQDSSQVNSIKKKPAIIKSAAAVFESPSNVLLPRAYLDPNDSCVIDSIFHDSSGISWYRIEFADHSGWIRSDFVRLAASDDQMQRGSEKSGDLDTDKKRRYRILFEHQDWPRRIQKFIREGRVCLGMTEEQLRASWGEPIQKSTMFMLGLGDSDVWFYKSSDGGMLIVGLSEGKVIGWSGKTRT